MAEVCASLALQPQLRAPASSPFLAVHLMLSVHRPDTGRWTLDAKDTGAERWLKKNGADPGAWKCFLSLDRDTQDAIRHMGSVNSARNPSAAIMRRIRDKVPGFMPLSEGMRLQQMVTGPFTPADVRPEVVIFFRGQVNRLGGNQEHGTSLATNTLAENLNSFANFLSAPLEEKGFKTSVFADLMGDETRLQEVEDELRQAFGSRFCEARVDTSFSASFRFEKFGIFANNKHIIICLLFY